jgi:hypothetical protein
VAARTIASSPRIEALNGLRLQRGTANRRDGEAAVICAGTSSLGNVGGKVLVAGKEVGGSLARRYGLRCQTAASVLGFSLIEFLFAMEKGETVLVDVEPLPQLVEPWASIMVGRFLKAISQEAL